MGVVVRQKVKGRGQPWWVFIHVNGKRRTKKIGDRQAAEAVASVLRRKLRCGELGITDDSNGSRTPTFGAYAHRFIEEHAKTSCKINTWARYQRIIKHYLLPEWEGRRLDQIRRADVKRLLAKLQTQPRRSKPVKCKKAALRSAPKPKPNGTEPEQLETTKPAEPLSGKSVLNISRLISGIFSQAVEDEVLASNPALRLGKYIKKSDRRDHAKSLTREQVADFLQTAHRHFIEHYAFLMTAFRTGMRQGELIGLAWSDLDFDSRSITVRRSFSHDNWSLPKSNKSRTVDMSNQLRTVLQGHWQDLQLRFGEQPPATRIGNTKSSAASLVQLVFPNWAGGPLDADNFRSRVFRRLIELADVPAIRFHDIRHTFASLLLAQGEPLHYVKEQLGHASIQTTVDVYGHLIPGSNRNAVNRLDDPSMPPVRFMQASSA